MATAPALDNHASTSSADPPKSKKPSNSAFKQQKLAAWQPILTAGTVLPTFFVIGILFIPVGIGLWYFSDHVREKIIPYTDCMSIKDPSKACSDIIGDGTMDGSDVPECTCSIPFNLDVDFKGKVYMYYGLTNFYQNHRRYVKSRDDNQLYGYADNGEPDKACAPYDMNKNKTAAYWPCGAIANSMFQDEITLFQSSGEKVDLIKTGIAWESDKNFKFKNPKNWTSEEFKKKHIKPIAWRKSPWELDPENLSNNGVQNEDFIVWMRTAALPNFRKLYRIVSDKGSGFRDGMPRGNYTLEIKYSYPVKSFRGTKSIIISTTSLLGGKNPFLGISYVVVGSVCLVLGIVFLFVHINYGKSTFAMTNVDTRTPY